MKHTFFLFLLSTTSLLYGMEKSPTHRYTVPLDVFERKNWPTFPQLEKALITVRNAATHNPPQSFDGASLRHSFKLVEEMAARGHAPSYHTLGKYYTFEGILSKAQEAFYNGFLLGHPSCAYEYGNLLSLHFLWKNSDYSSQQRLADAQYSYTLAARGSLYDYFDNKNGAITLHAYDPRARRLLNEQECQKKHDIFEQLLKHTKENPNLIAHAQIITTYLLGTKGVNPSVKDALTWYEHAINAQDFTMQGGFNLLKEQGIIALLERVAEGTMAATQEEQEKAWQLIRHQYIDHRFTHQQGNSLPPALYSFIEKEVKGNPKAAVLLVRTGTLPSNSVVDLFKQVQAQYQKKMNDTTAAALTALYPWILKEAQQSAYAADTLAQTLAKGLGTAIPQDKTMAHALCKIAFDQEFYKEKNKSSKKHEAYRSILLSKSLTAHPLAKEIKAHAADAWYTHAKENTDALFSFLQEALSDHPIAEITLEKMNALMQSIISDDCQARQFIASPSFNALQETIEKTFLKAITADNKAEYVNLWLNIAQLKNDYEPAIKKAGKKSIDIYQLLNYSYNYSNHHQIPKVISIACSREQTIELGMKLIENMYTVRDEPNSEELKEEIQKYLDADDVKKAINTIENFAKKNKADAAKIKLFLYFHKYKQVLNADTPSLIKERATEYIKVAIKAEELQAFKEALENPFLTFTIDEKLSYCLKLFQNGKKSEQKDLCEYACTTIKKILSDNNPQIRTLNRPGLHTLYDIFTTMAPFNQSIARLAIICAESCSESLSEGELLSMHHRIVAMNQLDTWISNAELIKKGDPTLSDENSTFYKWALRTWSLVYCSRIDSLLSKLFEKQQEERADHSNFNGVCEKVLMIAHQLLGFVEENEKVSSIADPNTPDPEYNLLTSSYIKGNIGCLYMLKKDYEKAHIYLQQAIKGHCSSKILYCYSELLFNQLGHSRHGQEVFNEALDILLNAAPTHKPIKEYLTTILNKGINFQPSCGGILSKQQRENIMRLCNTTIDPQSTVNFLPFIQQSASPFSEILQAATHAIDEHNYTTAYQLLEPISDKDEMAAALLGWLYIQGLGVSRSVEKAQTYLDKVIERTFVDPKPSPAGHFVIRTIFEQQGNSNEIRYTLIKSIAQSTLQAPPNIDLMPILTSLAYFLEYAETIVLANKEPIDKFFTSGAAQAIHNYMKKEIDKLNNTKSIKTYFNPLVRIALCYLDRIAENKFPADFPVALIESPFILINAIFNIIFTQAESLDPHNIFPLLDQKLAEKLIQKLEIVKTLPATPSVVKLLYAEMELAQGRRLIRAAEAYKDAGVKHAAIKKSQQHVTKAINQLDTLKEVCDEAKRCLANLYENNPQVYPFLKSEPEKSLLLLEELARKGNTDALLTCGLIAEKNKSDRNNIRKAEKFYKEAADLGNAQAISKLLVFYLTHPELLDNNYQKILQEIERRASPAFSAIVPDIKVLNIIATLKTNTGNRESLRSNMRDLINTILEQHPSTNTPINLIYLKIAYPVEDALLQAFNTAELNNEDKSLLSQLIILYKIAGNDFTKNYNAQKSIELQLQRAKQYDPHSPTLVEVEKEFRIWQKNLEHILEEENAGIKELVNDLNYENALKIVSYEATLNAIKRFDLLKEVRELRRKKALEQLSSATIVIRTASNKPLQKQK